MLPIIDISELPDEQARISISEEIREATSNSGFFYLTGHGIKTSVASDLRQSQRDFFALTTAEKNAISISEFNRGYLAQGSAKMHGSETYDQKEVFFWGAELDPQHPDIIQQTPLCGPNQWPHTLPNFKSSVLNYAEAIRSTGNKVLQCIALSLGAPATFFEPYFTDSLLRGQLIYYPPTEGSEQNFGVAPHTDFGCITLLMQETAGLEVWQNEQWIEAPPIADTLVVNIGDLLERWSNQKLPSTRHRVRNRSPNARYSIAMFHDPSPNARIDPLDLDPAIGQRKVECVKAAEYILGRNRGAFAHYGELAKS